MGLRTAAFAVIVTVIVGLGGCSTLNPETESARKSAGLDKPDHPKALPWNQDVDDPYGFVGKESGRPVEKDPDPWYQRYFMSGEARNIERNLGVD
jgi:hypothetical protein